MKKENKKLMTLDGDPRPRALQIAEDIRKRKGDLELAQWMEEEGNRQLEERKKQHGA